MASIVNNPIYFEYNKVNTPIKIIPIVLLEPIEDDEEITDESFFNYYEDDTYDGLYLC